MTDKYPMVPVPTAIQLLLQSTSDLISSNPTLFTSEEKLSISPSLLHRTISRDVIAPEPGFPPFPASIMDGYAIRYDETLQNTTENFTHHIKTKIYAGETASPQPLDSTSSNECAYITTGAVVPPEYDTVIPIEHVILSDDKTMLKITQPYKKYQWIRPIGCDVAPNEIILKANQTIVDEAMIGLLIQLGINEVCVKRKLRIGVLSTGTELNTTTTSAPTSTGQINDINRPILLTLLSQNPNLEPIDLGITPDSPSTLRSKLTSSLSTLDILLSTGGVSMGEKDYLLQVLTDLKAHCIFGRLHMKPGKPTKCFLLENKLLLCLPGNPVSALVCTHLLLTPLVNLILQGGNLSTATLHPERVCVYRGNSIGLDEKRPEYHRIKFDNVNEVISTGVQRSSRIMSMVGADGVMCLPVTSEEKKSVEDGDEVLVLAFHGNKGVMMKDSKHMQIGTTTKKKKKEIYNVGVLSVSHEEYDATNYKNRVSAALGKYYQISFSKSICPDDSLIEHLPKHSNTPQIMLVILNDSQIPFQTCLSHSNTLYAFLKSQKGSKLADGMALQARRGAALQCPQCALFEIVMGWYNGIMVICLPERGMEGALKSLNKVLGHSMKVAMGKCDRGHGHGK